MNTLDLLNNLPDRYLEDKNTLGFRFYVLDDIVRAGSGKPISYDYTYEPHILELYQDKPAVALYVHSPWCRSRCTYCYYHQGLEVQEQEMRDLIQAEHQHALWLENKIDLKSKAVRSIYFGGGTPTILPATLLEENLSFFASRYAQFAVRRAPIRSLRKS
jgi:coproporphyrinogen III oxidase-like Fe-S oxidoreductase